MSRKSPFRSWILRIFSSLVLVILVAIVVVLSKFHPSEVWFSPACTFRTWTGLRCPGCGLTRALYSLLHGELWEAFSYNPLIVLIPPLFLILCALLVFMLIRGRLPNLPPYPLLFGWFAFWFLTLFWAARILQDLSVI